METSGKSGSAGSRACSADPGSHPSVINSGLLAEFSSLTCPHSRTRPAPLNDFNWPRPLPPTADQPRQEDRVTSSGASRTRTVRTGSPALHRLSYRGWRRMKPKRQKLMPIEQIISIMGGSLSQCQYLRVHR